MLFCESLSLDLLLIWRNLHSCIDEDKFSQLQTNAFFGVLYHTGETLSMLNDLMRLVPVRLGLNRLQLDFFVENYFSPHWSHYFLRLCRRFRYDCSSSRFVGVF